MRILAVTPSFFPIVGGAELLVRDALNSLAERHHVTLMTPFLPPECRPFWVKDREYEDGCRFGVRRFHDRASFLKIRGHRVLRGAIPPMSITAIGELRRMIRAERADAILSVFAVPYGLPVAIAAARERIPYAVVFCGTDLPSPRTTDVPLWRSYLRSLARHAFRAVFVSRFSFGLLGLGELTGPHYCVIPGAVPLDECTDPKDVEALRRELRIGPDDLMLFALQRLGPEKRVDVVIEAFAALPRIGRRVRLVIGGCGPEEGRLRELAQRRGVADDVVFTGHLGEEKDIYYQACDIFVFHSMFETFGQVLVEAMRASKPIVSVEAGAIPEVVGGPEVALLSRPGDPAGLAAHIVELACDEALRQSMGDAARRRVESLFDWRDVQERWASLFSPAAVAETSDVPARSDSASLRPQQQ